MANCKYCGNEAGFLSRSHKACEEKHNFGIQGLTGMLNKYFQGLISAAKMGQNIRLNKGAYFLKDDDIAFVASKAIADFSASLRLPYTTQIVTKISDFIKNIGISYQKLNENGVMDELGQKLMQGYLVDFFTVGAPMTQINQNILILNNVIPLTGQQQVDAHISVLNKAASNFMKNGYISDSEEKLINSYSSYLGLSLNNLPSKFANTNLEKVSQTIILNNVRKGVFPQNNISVPVLLGRGEHPLWVYHDVIMLQEKVRKEYRGRNGGFSFRIMKGVTYRTGQFRGHPIEYSYMEHIGVGSLVVTDKHLYFHCPTASIKIPFTKLIGVSPYSDALEIHKDEAKPKRIVFKGLDSWFIMNLLSI